MVRENIGTVLKITSTHPNNLLSQQLDTAQQTKYQIPINFSKHNKSISKT